MTNSIQTSECALHKVPLVASRMHTGFGRLVTDATGRTVCRKTYRSPHPVMVCPQCDGGARILAMVVCCEGCGVRVNIGESHCVYSEACGFLDVCGACKAQIDADARRRVCRDGWRAVGIIVGMALGLLGLAMTSRGC